jgi:putative transposase
MPLPHLSPFVRHPLVFLTVCTAHRVPVLNNVGSHTILAKLWHDSRQRNGWRVGRYVIMPDHIHLFAMPGENPESFREWVSIWKSISARQIVLATGAVAPIWQRDYFDRFIRTAESYGDKWDYVWNNPVRAGLVGKTEDWPYQGVIHDLGHCMR